MADQQKRIFKPDGKNSINDGIEHAPGGGKARMSTGTTLTQRSSVSTIEFNSTRKGVVHV